VLTCANKTRSARANFQSATDRTAKEWRPTVPLCVLQKAPFQPSPGLVFRFADEKAADGSSGFQITLSEPAAASYGCAVSRSERGWLSHSCIATLAFAAPKSFAAVRMMSTQVRSQQRRPGGGTCSQASGKVSSVFGRVA
jgi:hypothetical protein